MCGLTHQLLLLPLQVQLQHNKRKSEALRELLASTAEAAATTECASSGANGHGSGRAHDSCSRATAALQDLLDELLESSTAADGQ